MEYVCCRLFLALKGLVSLKGYQNAVTYSVVFQYEFRRGEIHHRTFDVVYHILTILSYLIRKVSNNC